MPQLGFAHVEFAELAMHVAQEILRVVADPVQERIALCEPETAEGWSFRKSGEDRRDIAAFGFRQADLFRDKFSATFSALKFQSIVIGIWTSNFTVGKQ